MTTGLFLPFEYKSRSQITDGQGVRWVVIQEQELAEIQDQRADLLAACEAGLGAIQVLRMDHTLHPEMRDAPPLLEVIIMLRDAIAKVRGDK